MAHFDENRTNEVATVLLSVVVPMKNEGVVLDAFFLELLPILESITLNFEVIVVNDGSDDDTLTRLLGHQRQDPRISVLDLSRNFGKEAALTAGMEFSKGQAVVTMDADLQHPPKLLLEMVTRWREGYEMVIACRSDRNSDSFIKRWTAGWFYSLINNIADHCCLIVFKKEKTAYIQQVVALVA